MWLPPDGQTANATAPAMAANTFSGGVVVVPAPGAGRRLRLWAAVLYDANTADAVSKCFVVLRETGGFVGMARLSGIFGAGPLVLPGGIGFPSNVAMDAVFMANAANPTLGVEVYYTLEDV